MPEPTEPRPEPDAAYLNLKGARERLCRAQMHVPDHWRRSLDEAVHLIDEVGSSIAPAQWSVYDQPEYPENPDA